VRVFAGIFTFVAVHFYRRPREATIDRGLRPEGVLDAIRIYQSSAKRDWAAMRNDLAIIGSLLPASPKMRDLIRREATEAAAWS
jgi:hypothetical protein